MTVIDYPIALFFNHFVGRSWLFDQVVFFSSDQDLLKGGFALALFWYAWFRCDGTSETDRRRLLSLILACLVALAISQTLQLTMPFRYRPIHTTALNLTVADGMPSQILDGWSSFPSDHAALFYALSTGFLFVSRPLGLLSLLHTTLFVCFPRIYLGLHFFSDLFAGALLGIALSILMCSKPDPTGLGGKLLEFCRNNSALFYAALFLVTIEFARLFTDLREITRFMIALLKVILGIS
jgi:undecaprenyl-diphosphatase